MLLGSFVKNHNVKGKPWYCLYDMSTMSVSVWDMKSITVIFLFIRFVMSEKWIPPTVFLSEVCCDAQQHRNESRNGSWLTGSCRFLGFTNCYRHFIGNFCSSSSDPHILRNPGHVECSFRSLKFVVILCSHSHPTCPEPPVCRQGRHVWFGSRCSCLLVVWFQHTTTSGLGVPLSTSLGEERKHLSFAATYGWLICGVFNLPTTGRARSFGFPSTIFLFMWTHISLCPGLLTSPHH